MVVAAAVLAAAAGLATADEHPSDEDRAAEIGLAVTAGYDGRPQTGAWTPVEVTLQPSRVTAGVLAVEARGRGGLVREEREIEVATGSRTAYRFLVPGGPVSVRLDEPGRPPLTVSPRRGPGGREFLVGTLGPVPPDAPSLRSEPLGVTGTWVSVHPAWVELSPAALASLGALVVDRSVLADLPAQARRNLAAAVAAGTDVVVVAARDGPLSFDELDLPWAPASAMATTTVDAGDEGPLDVRVPATADPAWQLDVADVLDGPAPGTPVAASTPAGRGRVAVVGAAPGDGLLGRSEALWSTLAGPGRRPTEARDEWSVESDPYQFPSLLADGAAGAPALPWLAAFIVVYVVVVGPLNAVVLGRMRRRELAWVTVPLVTAVFTAGAYFGAVGGRPPVGLGAGLVTWVDGVATETAVTGARAPTPGVRQVVVPGDDWTVRTLTQGQEPAVVRRDGDLRVDLALTALETGGVIARRATGAAAPLTVAAVAAVDGVEVTVTNVSDTAVDGVVVRTATAVKTVGDLRPGASASATVGGARLPRIDPWGEHTVNGMGGHPGLPRSLETVLRGDVMDGNPGLVWAVGTIATGAPGVRVDGRRVRDDGVLVAVAVPPDLPSDGGVTAHAVDRALVGAGEDSHRVGPLAVESGGEAHLRFRLPPGGVVPVLHQALADGGRAGGRIEVEVWDQTVRRWVGLGEAFGTDGGAPEQLVDPLGQVWVRARGDLFPFDYSGFAVAGVEPDGGAR